MVYAEFMTLGNQAISPPWESPLPLMIALYSPSSLIPSPWFDLEPQLDPIVSPTETAYPVTPSEPTPFPPPSMFYEWISSPSSRHSDFNSVSPHYLPTGTAVAYLISSWSPITLSYHAVRTILSVPLSSFFWFLILLPPPLLLCHYFLRTLPETTVYIAITTCPPPHSPVGMRKVGVRHW